ncbi:MAG: hypothetical protein KAJ20_00615 [Candidatus Aenigmarchaeota archaeon]|nr:hypothetical protein [Candidatus Aenigmarchaeota archaeon]MCK5042527.1 hypothetical protein [Candidatus Aenigmarchaeota archaeon]MCK5372822.1 hypothetical protein [Candidatus Aenigmarchaeota archaeon]MCK5452077.1 hypothetical protein [Candidatus Aenigmarchaeota archaeon]
MRKGQFYIISVAVLIFMISLILASRFMYPSQTAELDRTQYMFTNMKSELNYVVNVIVADSTDSTNIEDKMYTFFNFLDIYSKNHNLDLEGYYIIGLPLGNGLNITVGNFRQYSLDNIEINITNSTGTQSRNITILGPWMESTLDFSSVFGSSENITVSIDFAQLDSPIAFNTTRKVFEVFELELGKQQDLWVNLVENS